MTLNELKPILEKMIKEKLDAYNIATHNIENNHFVDNDAIEYKSDIIRSYMFNKIRYHLNAYQRTHGYPSRMSNSVGFYGLLMFSVPDYTLVHKVDTSLLWVNDTSKAWRKVIIYDLPNEYVQDLFTVLHQLPIPYISNILTLSTMITKNLTKREHPIFENLITFGGLSDVVIKANWDKIKLLLNENRNERLL